MEKFSLIDGIHFRNNSQRVSYPDHGNELCFEIEDNSFWFKYRMKVIRFVIQKFLTPKSRIIDLGGGNGFVALDLQSAGYDTTLVEVGQGAYNAKKRGVQNIYCTNILDFESSGENKSDLITLLDVIEHINNPDEVLRHVRKNISPSALLLITVPAGESLWSQDDINAGHFRRYTQSSLAQELALNGYEVIYSRYFFTLLVLPIFLTKALPFKLSKNSKQQNPTPVTNDYISEHTGLLSKLLLKVLSIELFFLKCGVPLPFGSSIIAVARPKS